MTLSASDFKVGQKVRITKRIPTHANGWRNSWVHPEMTQTVGLIGTVKIVFATTNDVFVSIPTKGSWGYSPESLELVTESNPIYLPDTKTLIETKPNVSVPSPLVAQAEGGFSLRPRKSNVSSVAVEIGKKFGVVNAGLIQNELTKRGLFPASGAVIAAVLAGDSRFKNTGAQVNSKYAPARGRKVTQWEFQETPAIVAPAITEAKPNVSVPPQVTPVVRTTTVVLTEQIAKVGLTVKIGSGYASPSSEFPVGLQGVVSGVVPQSVYPVTVKFSTDKKGVFRYNELVTEVNEVTQENLKIGDRVKLSDHYFKVLGSAGNTPWTVADDFTVTRIEPLSYTNWPIRIKASDGSYGLVGYKEIVFA